MSQERFVGIDVSKELLDVAAAPDGESHTYTNDEKGIRQLVGVLGRQETGTRPYATP